MNILNKNAVASLLAKINALVDASQQNAWRCIYFNLSDSQARHRQGMYKHFVVDAVTGLLENDDGTIYICDDGDIFILFKGALKPIIDRLGVHFAGIRPRNLGEQPDDPRFTIFDLSRYWQVLFRLCSAKYLHTTYSETLPAQLAARAHSADPLETF